MRPRNGNTFPTAKDGYPILASERAIGGPVVLVRDEPPDDYHARRLAEDQARSERIARAEAREEAEIAYGRAMIEAAEAARAQVRHKLRLILMSRRYWFEHGSREAARRVTQELFDLAFSPGELDVLR